MEKKEISGYGEGNYFLGSGNTACILDTTSRQTLRVAHAKSHAGSQIHRFILKYRNSAHCTVFKLLFFFSHFNFQSYKFI